jgi:DNA-binding response OmpR family regulator
LLIAAADPQTRSRYRQLFDTAWNVADAEDGRDALVQSLLQPPVIFLGEERLPFIDGVDLCRLMRRDLQTRETRIILLTDDPASQRHERAKQAGADIVLVEPVEPDSLRAEVDRLYVDRLQSSVEPRGGGSLVTDKLEPAIDQQKPRRRKSRSHARFATKKPPLEPHTLICPVCDRPLRYQQSFVGGVNHSQREQWDHFSCPSCRGAFEFRHRTRRMRQHAG